MKKFLVFSLLTVYFLSFSTAQAIDVVLSKNNLRLNNDSTSTSFTATLSDDISGLSGSGFIPAKLKIKSKSVSASTTTIMIPYTDGSIGTSDEVTLTLLDTVSKSQKVPLKISVPGKYRKKYKVGKFSKTLNLDADAIKLTGKVTIPSGDVNSFRTRTRKKLASLRDRGIAPFNTETPEGVIVELFEIDPESGEPVGQPLMQAITDEDGGYEMEMPPEADFGSGFALVVEGDNNESMHAPLFSDSVPVNPATEALFELTQEAIDDPSAIGLPPLEDISFENFNETELEGLNDQMEELNPIYEDTLDESITSLKQSYADFLNNMLGFAADDDSTNEGTDLTEVAKGIAGDYNVVFFNTRITSEERIDLGVELAAGRMSKPDEVGSLTVTPLPSFSTRASLNSSHGDGGPDNDEGPNDNFDDQNDNQGPNDDFDNQGDDNQGPGNDDNGGDLSSEFDDEQDSQDDNFDDQQNDNFDNQGEGGAACYEIEAESDVEREARNADDQGNFYMTVDANKVISFAEPAIEETFDNPDGTYIYRSQPSVMNMIPVGDDMFLSSMLSIGSNISPQNEVENEYEAGFGSIIKRSKFAEGDFTGTYGIVGLGYQIGDSSYGARSFLGSLTFNGSSVDFNLNTSSRNVNVINCGSSYALESGDEEEQGTAQLSFQGDRVSIIVDDNDSKTETLFTGFSRSDKRILTLAYAQDSGAKGSKTGGDGKKRNVIESAERQMIFGVKQPNSQLSLDGKSYKILSLNFAFNSQGGRTIESGEVGTLSFASGLADVSSLTKSSFARATGASESVDASSSSTTEAGISYTLGSNGAISFVLGEEELSGFVAEDSTLIILNADGDNNLGIYLAVLEQ